MNTHVLETHHLTLDQFNDINTTTKSEPIPYQFIVIFQQHKKRCKFRGLHACAMVPF